MRSTTCTLLILAAMWVPPVLAIAGNRAKPDLSTALGVPYAFLAGLLFAVAITVIVALGSLRWPALKPHYLVVAIAGALNLALLFAADRGMLSITQG